MRLSDCAADANLPLEYRSPELDEKLRHYIGNEIVPARAFTDFLRSVISIVSSAFEVSGDVGDVGSRYRQLALRCVHDATNLLENAAKQGKSAPFVFFACVQDAVSATRMFAAAADQRLDGGFAEASLASFTGAKPAETQIDSTDAATLKQEANEKFQILFDATASPFHPEWRLASTA